MTPVSRLAGPSPGGFSSNFFLPDYISGLRRRESLTRRVKQVHLLLQECIYTIKEVKNFSVSLLVAIRHEMTTVIWRPNEPCKAGSNLEFLAVSKIQND